MVFRRLRRANCGGTAIEYALVAALIAVAGIMAFRNTGEGVDATMTEVSDAMPDAGNGVSGPAPAGAPPAP